MKKEAKTKKELIKDLLDLSQQPTELEKSRSETQNSLQKLRASETRYRRLFETAQDGILILNAETGSIEDVNPYMIDMLHYSYEEFQGKQLWEVSPFKDTVLNQVAFAELQDKGYIRYKDLPLETKEGKRIAVEFVSNVYKSNGNKVIQCNIRNITERKQAEGALEESENKYRLLADNVNDVIFVLDMNLKYTYVSPSVKILRGYDQEEVLKQPSFETLTPSSWDLAMGTLSETMELEKLGPRAIPGSRTLQLEMRRKDGSTVWTEVKFSFIRGENQQPVGILGVTRDITERRQTSIELQISLEKLRKALGGIIQVVSATVETRDPYTSGHQRRVADLARSIAQEMGLPKNQADGLQMAGIIHDLGKIAVPAEILSKPTKLTDLEFGLIKVHPQISYDILKDIDFPWPVAEIILQHHERMNGSGYPQGLKGDRILLEARILMVADVVEAMASYRPYRPALGIDIALEEIEKNKGILYDPEVVEVCLRLFKEMGFGFEKIPIGDLGLRIAERKLGIEDRH
ncbi:MAG: HD domain-containing phosphohydrolase [Candidatus Aquicultor sp.]